MKAKTKSLTAAEAAIVFQRSVGWVYAQIKAGLLVEAGDTREPNVNGGARAVKLTKASVDALNETLRFGQLMAAQRRGVAMKVAEGARRALLAAAAKSVPWRERPVLTLKIAAEIAGVSPATLYRFNSEDRLVFKNLGGRTLVDTSSLVALIDSAAPYAPDPRRTKMARAARQNRHNDR